MPLDITVQWILALSAACLVLTSIARQVALMDYCRRVMHLLRSHLPSAGYTPEPPPSIADSFSATAGLTDEQLHRVVQMLEGKAVADAKFNEYVTHKYGPSGTRLGPEAGGATRAAA